MFVMINKRSTLIYASLALTLLMSTSLFLGAQAQDPVQNGDAANKVYLPLITGTNGGTQSINLEQLALELVAAHHTLVIDELAIDHWSSTDYSSQGVIAFTFTVMDNHDGMSYDVTLDKDGQELDLTQLEVVESAQLKAVEQADYTAIRAREYVATLQNIPIEQLTITEKASSYLPLTNVNLADFKVISRDGRIFSVSFDVATKQLVDSVNTAQQEQKARMAKYGVLEPALYERLQSNSSGRFPVAIWFAAEDLSTLARSPNMDLNVLRARVHSIQSPVADVVSGLGATAHLADLAPLIFADLNASQINTLSRRSDIIAIQLLPQNHQLLLDDSATSDRYPFIWSSATGNGAKVAIHEPDAIDDANIFLIDPMYWCTAVGTGPGGTACTKGKNIMDSELPYGHATSIAGVIASTHNWRRGMAWGITAGSLLSANFQSFGDNAPSVGEQNMVNSALWASNSGADIINMSWGACTNGRQDFDSSFVDYLVRTTGNTIVSASGNRDCVNIPGLDPLFVFSPSLGWNTISVGAYRDNNTGLRIDDSFADFTSYKNPIDLNSGRTYEKPDVTGLGCVETTQIGNGVDNSACGTSLAAPDVSALASLVIGKNPTGLRHNAEAVKAIIMAGATHNIVDAVNYKVCPNISSLTPDCRDGAGAIDAYQTIQNIVVPGNWRFLGPITPSSFNAAGNIEYTTSLNKGKNVRVVIAWDSMAVCSDLGTGSQSCASDVLNADLDLIVLDPKGFVILPGSVSASLQNSAEVVDFTAPMNGTYTIRIHNSRFTANTSTYLGVAWNKDTSDTLNPLTGVTSFSLNTTKTNQTTDKGSSFWDRYSGSSTECATFLANETGLEKVYQISTKKTGKITATLSDMTGYTSVESDIDVIILKKSGAADNQNNQTITCGGRIATISNQPAGTYYIVVDGFNGAVAKFSLTVNFTAGAAVESLTEPLPQR